VSEKKGCPSCGAKALETYYVCDACGDDYTGGAMAKVLDAHTAALRARLATEYRRGVEDAAKMVLLEDVDGLSPYTVAARIRALAGDAKGETYTVGGADGVTRTFTRDAPKEQP
jgi:hypothetical protein